MFVNAKLIAELTKGEASHEKDDTKNEPSNEEERIQYVICD